MKTTALLLAVLVAGCAVQSAPLAPEGDAPDQADGAPTTPEADGGRTVDSPPQVSGDGGPDGGQVGKVDAAPEAAAPDATPPPSPDAGPSGPDAAPPTLDARTDSAPAPDAVAQPDGGHGGDASAPPADVAGDAAPDAAPGDAGTGADPVCTSPLPACTNAISADEAIRATFTKPCTPEGDKKCGGVYRGVVETLPMVCRSGQWRLAGSWSGVQWVPGHECSTGCAAGKVCNP